MTTATAGIALVFDLDTEGQIAYDLVSRRLSWPTAMDTHDVRHMSNAGDPEFPAIEISTTDGIVTLTLGPGLTFDRLLHIVMATGTFEARDEIESVLRQWGIRRGRPLPA
jgi:hypothetical protein